MLAALLTLSLTAAQPDPPKPKDLPEAAQKELKKLDGRWKVVKGADSNKETEADPKEPAVEFVFKGSNLTMEYMGMKESIRITALDPTTDPKCIDLTETRRDKTERTLEGVFKIDGDTLRIALHITKDGKQRPTSFDKPTDARTVVWTLKRIKE